MRIDIQILGNSLKEIDWHINKSGPTVVISSVSWPLKIIIRCLYLCTNDLNLQTSLFCSGKHIHVDLCALIKH